MNADFLVAHFDALNAAGRVSEGVAFLAEHAERGMAEAQYLYAVQLLAGNGIARDLPAARGVLRQAAQVKHEAAALLEIALTANGTGGAPDWAAARQLLKLLAADSEIARRQLALLEAMDLDEQGDPLRKLEGRNLSQSPHVRYFTGIVSQPECAWIATAARDMLEPAVVIDPKTGRMINHPVRTSSGAVIGPGREDLVIRAINRRLANVSGTNVDQGEPLSVLHYSAGQQYRPHLDAVTGVGNQRIKTAIIYLNHGYAGGETRFSVNGLTVRGGGGDVLVFDNTAADGRPDPRSEHAGLPVTAGVKWIATRWIRARPYDPWLGG